MNRLARVIDAGGRYVRNIASMKRFAKDYESNGIESARKRSYSRSTYMMGNNER